MKKLFYLFGILTLSLAASCIREEAPKEDERLQFAEQTVRIGASDAVTDDDTKSVINIQTENFQEAYLFCFLHSTKKIAAYDSSAGNLAGQPVAIYTTSKSFNWAIPVGTPIDVWVVVNPGNLKSSFDSYLSNKNLTESDLEGVYFQCASSNALKALQTEGYGMPMSGKMNNLTLSLNQGLDVTVKRLFAKYNFSFDLSGFNDAGYDVDCISIYSSNNNTRVPFFYDGNYAGNDLTVETIDYGSEADKIALVNDQQITLYFLENCQGDKSYASSWKTVYDDFKAAGKLSELQKCSYVDFGVRVRSTATGSDETMHYRVYLGDKSGGFYSNFDVKRNYFHSVILKLSPEASPAAEYFSWKNNATLSVAPGATIAKVPFEFKYLDGTTTSEFVVYTDENCTNKIDVIQATNPIYSVNSGTINISVPSSVSIGTYYVMGGKNLTDTEKRICSVTPLMVTDPTVLGYSWNSGSTAESYIGMDRVFTLTGLQSGETITSVNPLSGTYAKYSFSGNQVTFAPGHTSQSIRVNTSAGRSLDVPVTAKSISIAATNPTLVLSLTGDPGFPGVHYVDAANPSVTLEKSAFNSQFYSSYLQLMNISISNPSSAGVALDLFRSNTSNGSDSGVYAYVYDISKGVAFSAKYGKMFVGPVNYSPISRIDINLQCKEVTVGNLVDLGAFHDFSLIPGNLDSGANTLLYRAGYSSPSIDSKYYSIPKSSIDASYVSSLSGFTASSGSLTYSVSSDNYTFTLSDDGTYHSLDAGTYIYIQAVITNSRSNTSYDAKVGYVKLHKHLAIGGIRNSLYQNRFNGVAQFASNNMGSENTRYSDWPSSAITLKNRFKPGGNLAGCVTAFSSGYSDQVGGVVVRRVESDGSDGTGHVLYTFTYSASGSYTPSGMYSTEKSYHKLNSYGGATLQAYTNYTGQDATYELIIGFYHIHDYKNIASSTNGWLQNGNTAERYTF